jgi:hypothetical protein
MWNLFIRSVKNDVIERGGRRHTQLARKIWQYVQEGKRKETYVCILSYDSYKIECKCIFITYNDSTV